MHSAADALTPDLLLAHERFVRRVAKLGLRARQRAGRALARRLPRQRGDARWHVVRSHLWEPDEDCQPAPVWRALTLATTVPWRLCLLARDGGELASHDLAR